VSTGKHRGWHAPRDGRACQRVPRLQRRRDRDRLAAGGWRRAHRVRGHRRAPRRRGAGRVLRRSPGADDQLAPAPGDAVPYTGLPAETGGSGAEGSAVNVAEGSAGTGDAPWLRTFHAIVPPLLRQFRPQILVSQHGADTHRLDPLAHLELSIDAQRAAHAAIHDLAHDLAGGRWLLIGGGGYDLVRVVPRTWTHLLAEAAGQPIGPAAATPVAWRDYVARRTCLPAPRYMTEGAPARFEPFESGYDPGDPGDRAIIATRHEIFPLHGLMPL
jgi:acetoin utilization protein AcuC